MIITKLIGGLGNQMFQYAAGKALACQHQVDVRVDVSELNQNAEGKFTQRHYELDIFSGAIQTASAKDLEPFSNRGNNKLQRELQRKLPFLFNTLIAVECGSAFHPEFVKYPKHTYLQGFWQSELYFKKYESEIRNGFQFKTQVVEVCKNLVIQIKSCNSVSLHVRRGDYVSNQSTFKFHGLCSPEYYNKAVKHFLGLYKEVEIFVFSDDIDWCKENLKFDTPVHFMTTASAHEDLYLMTQCCHNIIANSSFSWWGAWLNHNPDKIVMAPKHWFADTSINDSDIIPASWLKL